MENLKEVIMGIIQRVKGENVQPAAEPHTGDVPGNTSETANPFMAAAPAAKHGNKKLIFFGVVVFFVLGVGVSYFIAGFNNNDLKLVKLPDTSGSKRTYNADHRFPGGAAPGTAGTHDNSSVTMGNNAMPQPDGQVPQPGGAVMQPGSPQPQPGGSQPVQPVVSAMQPGSQSQPGGSQPVQPVHENQGKAGVQTPQAARQNASIAAAQPAPAVPAGEPAKKTAGKSKVVTEHDPFKSEFLKKYKHESNKELMAIVGNQPGINLKDITDSIKQKQPAEKTPPPPPPPPPLKRDLKLTVSGVMLSTRDAYAISDYGVIRVGDSVGSYVVEKITDSSVIFRHPEDAKDVKSITVGAVRKKDDKGTAGTAGQEQQGQPVYISAPMDTQPQSQPQAEPPVYDQNRQQNLDNNIQQKLMPY